MNRCGYIGLEVAVVVGTCESGTSEGVPTGVRIVISHHPRKNGATRRNPIYHVLSARSQHNPFKVEMHYDLVSDGKLVRYESGRCAKDYP